MSGRATFTMLMSRTTISWAIRMTERTMPRRGSRAAAWGARTAGVSATSWSDTGMSPFQAGTNQPIAVTCGGRLHLLYGGSLRLCKRIQEMADDALTSDGAPKLRADAARNRAKLV